LQIPKIPDALAVVLLVLEKTSNKLIDCTTAVDAFEMASIELGRVGYRFSVRCKLVVALDGHHVQARVDVGGPRPEVGCLDQQLVRDRLSFSLGFEELSNPLFARIPTCYRPLKMRTTLISVGHDADACTLRLMDEHWYTLVTEADFVNKIGSQLVTSRRPEFAFSTQVILS
jgi:hypothetical protein